MEGLGVRKWGFYGCEGGFVGRWSQRLDCMLFCIWKTCGFWIWGKDEGMFMVKIGPCVRV